MQIVALVGGLLAASEGKSMTIMVRSVTVGRQGVMVLKH